MCSHRWRWYVILNFDPGATLVFETELVDVGESPPAVNVFKDIDADADNLLSREEVWISTDVIFFQFATNESSSFQVVEYIKKQMPEDGADSGDEADPDKITEEIFQHEDKDRDGFISHEEFSGPKHDEL